MWYESVVGLLNHCDLDDSDSIVIIYIIYNLSSNDAFFAVSMRVILKLWIWSFVGTPDSVTGADVTMKDGQASHGSLSNPTWNSFEFHIVRTTPSCTMLLAMGIWRFSRPSNLGYQIGSWLLEKCQELLEGTEKEWPNDSWNVLRNSPWAQILNRCFFCSSAFQDMDGGRRTWILHFGCGCFRKLGYPKMDGENNGKPYSNGWFWGENPLFSETSVWHVKNMTCHHGKPDLRQRSDSAGCSSSEPKGSGLEPSKITLTTSSPSDFRNSLKIWVRIATSSHNNNIFPKWF